MNNIPRDFQGPTELSKFITSRREELGMSLYALSVESGISHTEVKRIEEGLRKQPSLSSLEKLAGALSVSKEHLMGLAGYIPKEEQTLLEFNYPGLKTPKQRETVESIIDGLSRNSDLEDSDLDQIVYQVNLIINAKANQKK